MTTLAATAERLRRLGAQMKPDLPAVDLAVSAVRALLRGSGLPFRIIGGLAVMHHGYERFTTDVDVLVPADAAEHLDPLLERYGFARETATRLRHLPTGVRVDVLPAGMVLRGPRPAEPLPAPTDVVSSERDPEVAGLATVLMLKLEAGRRQDVADVVQLLKGVDDAAYVYLESDLRPDLRPELASLRDEALEELSWERLNGA